MRPVLAFALLFAVSCARAAAPPDTTPRPAHSPGQQAARPAVGATTGMRREPTTQERVAIRQLLAGTERIRGLRLSRDVRIAVADHTNITRHLTDQLEDEDLLESRRMYVALGLLDPEVDLEALLNTVIGEQVIGFYDPKVALLVVRDDVMASLGRGAGGDDETRIVIVHELDHALQDEHFDLRANMDRERDTDAENAYHSVVEGDATLTMIGFVTEARGMPLSAVTQSPELLARIGAASGAGGGEALASAPAILRVSLVAPYMRGLVFCAALHAERAFAGVDAAFREPPVSMEQVLHPQKYLAREAPIPVALPRLPTLEAAGYVAGDEDTLGELEIGVFLALGTRRDTNDVAAAGWGGDRLRVYNHPTEPTAIVWRLDWDTEADAIEAERAARNGLTTVPEGRRMRYRVERRGRALLVLRDLPATEHDAVVSATLAAPVSR